MTDDGVMPEDTTSTFLRVEHDVLTTRRKMTPEVAQARKELLEARGALEEELDGLTDATRSALDIPAKVRRNPVKAAGVAAGVGFVAVGGPRRLLRRAKRAVMGPEEPLPETMLPDEIEKALKRMGKDGVRVRGLLEREFADYLRTTEKARRDRSIPDAVTASLIVASRPFIIAAARRLAGQAFSPDAPGFQAQVDRIRARRATADAERAEADALAEAEADVTGI